MSNLVVDLTETPSGIQAVLYLEGTPTTTRPQLVTWPLPATLVELRWYLEDYLDSPYAAYVDRASRTRGNLTAWGERLFLDFFGEDEAFDLYERFIADPAGAGCIDIRSTSSRIHRLPWELLRRPGAELPAVLQAGGIVRSFGDRSATHVTAGAGSATMCRILLVISRPAGLRDAPYRQVAQKIVRRAADANVEVAILRPPTTVNLRSVLRDASRLGRPFTVVHFDGHGYQAQNIEPGMAGDHATSLVFESSDGRSDPISAEAFADALAGCGVSLVVLNACRSGAIGDDVQSSIAGHLLERGITSVLAMSYAVNVLTASEFMDAFYENLVASGDVPTAVRAGRAQLQQRQDRRTAAGMMELSDWMVPALFGDGRHNQPSIGIAPDARPESSHSVSIGGEGARSTNGKPEARYGRNGEFWQLEHLLRQGRPILMHGVLGIGKTALADSFARWLADTGAVDKVVSLRWPSVIRGSSLVETIIRQTGDQLGVPPGGSAEDGLRDKRVIVVWDQFEALTSEQIGQSPAVKHWADVERFFRQVCSVGGGILLVSRSPERWLRAVSRIELTGLDPASARFLWNVRTARLDVPETVTRQVLARSLGNPLVIADYAEVVAKQVDLRPSRWVANLVSIKPDTTEPVWPTIALRVRISAVLDTLDVQTRGALEALAGFTDFADIRILERISQATERPSFRGLDRTDWLNVIGRAVDVGLLAPLEAPDIYQIVPGMATVCARSWQSIDADDDPTKPQYAMAFIRGFAHLASLTRADDRRAMWRHRKNLEAALAASLCLGWTSEASTLMELLNLILKHEDEASRRKWLARCISISEPFIDASSPPRSMLRLWTHGVGETALADFDAFRLGEASVGFSRLMSVLLRQGNTGTSRRHAATTMMNLGNVARAAGDREGALRRYAESVAMHREVGDFFGVARVQANIAVVARESGDIELARSALTESLAYARASGDLELVAHTELEIGHLAHQVGDVTSASQHYARAVAYHRDVGDRAALAVDYQNLGMLALRQRSLATAQDYLDLALAEKAHDPPSRGTGELYNLLGILAQERQEWDHAEIWHLRALSVAVELAEASLECNAYHELGIVELERGDSVNAQKYHLRALRMSRQQGDVQGISLALHEMAIIAKVKGNLQRARTLAKMALDLSMTQSNLQSISNSLNLLCQIAERTGDLEGALRFALRRDDLFDSGASHPWAGGTDATIYRLVEALGLEEFSRIWHEEFGTVIAPSFTEVGLLAPEIVNDERNDRMMESAVKVISRSVASRVESPVNSVLPAEVELELQRRYSTEDRREYLDGVSVASLVVSVVALVWDLWQARPSRNKQDLANLRRTVQRRVDELPDAVGVPDAQKVRIIAVAIEETARLQGIDEELGQDE